MNAVRGLRGRLVAGAVAVVAVLGAATAFAAPPTNWFQGFETDTNDWSAGVTRVASGTDGVTSAEGGWHATAGSGVFSRFGAYSDEFPSHGYVTEVDVYLDPSWPTGTGFDYSVASSNAAGAHRRDFIFHVGVVNGVGLVVNGSNNADFVTNPYKLLNDNGGLYRIVTEADWYTLQHAFRNDNGVLAVDLNLLDADGALLWSATRTNAADLIPSEVGGNRYAWFTHIDVPSRIHIDNHELNVVMPKPGTKDDCKNGGFEAFGFENQGQCVASVEANPSALK